MDTSEETRTENGWQPWTIILAGGSGRRLSDFLRRIHSDDRPKQFASLIGTRSMLQHTYDRARGHCPRERVLVVITEGQQRWAFPQLPHMPTQNFLVQPRNLDTGPAVALALAHVLDRDPLGTALILPSGHFVHPEEELSLRVDGMLRAVAGANGTCAVLLGAEPSDACEEMGWILPGERAGCLFSVKEFAEKPRLASARRLFRGGALWNTFILAGKARSLWYLLWKRMPENAA